MSAFLLVFSEPGGRVSLEEFQDWYNNEHIPLRLNHLPQFLSGARYQSIESGDDTWLSIYQVTHPDLFSHPSYTTLRENRSPREADLVKRLALLDRRCYHIVSVTSSGVPCGFELGEHTTQALLAYASTTDNPPSFPSSLRTHVLNLFDHSTMKHGATVSTDYPLYHVVHGQCPLISSSFPLTLPNNRVC